MDTLKIIICCILHFVVVSSIPQSHDFHKRLSKDQLQKYFSVDHHDKVPEYNLVNIKLKKSSQPPPTHIQSRDLHAKDGNHSANRFDLTFLATDSIFGHKDVQMQLQPNNRLLAPSLQVLEMGNNSSGRVIDTRHFPLCHYIGSNGSFAAAVSDCGATSAKGLSGILMLPNGSAQIQPVDEDLAQVLGINPIPGKNDKGSGKHGEEDVLHLIVKPSRHKRMAVNDELLKDYIYLSPSPEANDKNVNYLASAAEVHEEDTYNVSALTMDDHFKTLAYKMSKQKYLAADNGKPLYLELAVFVDQKAFELFRAFTRNEDSIVDLILGYVNQMQALYMQPSLKKKVQISLVRLEILKKQPSDFPHYEGNRGYLLESFCAYQSRKNPPTDSDPDHWDMALYLSGLDFFSIENGATSYATLGLAPVGGVCSKKYNCVIVEFGTTSARDGSPYGTAGLLSTFVGAHELGHNLGMDHDGNGPISKDCNDDDFLMSPYRAQKKQITWSKCSSKVLEYTNKNCLLDEPQKFAKGFWRNHNRFEGKPGQTWDAYNQCELFLRDEDATLYNNITDVCEEILCKSPNRIGYYSAGPALEGTFCGGKNWCKDGECVPWGHEMPNMKKGGWGDWRMGQCRSGCIKKSKAVIKDRRYCSNPRPINTEKRCEGDNVRIHFCDDSLLCKSYITKDEFADQRCKYFSKYLPLIIPYGAQAKFVKDVPWQSCMVYCKTEPGSGYGEWYTPRQDFNNMGIDTFFPEGTWCHNDGVTDYFCQNHLCQPPPSRGRALVARNGTRVRGPEVSVPVYNNARPLKAASRNPKKLREFFQYKEGEVPIMPRKDELKRPKDEDYKIVDYVLPK